jgi:hypothetical protein
MEDTWVEVLTADTFAGNFTYLQWEYPMFGNLSSRFQGGGFQVKWNS